MRSHVLSDLALYTPAVHLTDGWRKDFISDAIHAQRLHKVVREESNHASRNLGAQSQPAEDHSGSLEGGGGWGWEEGGGGWFVSHAKVCGSFRGRGVQMIRSCPIYMCVFTQPDQVSVCVCACVREWCVYMCGGCTYRHTCTDTTHLYTDIPHTHPHPHTGLGQTRTHIHVWCGASVFICVVFYVRARVN